MQNHPVIDMEQIAHQFSHYVYKSYSLFSLCVFLLLRFFVNFALALCSIKTESKQQCNEIHKRKRKQKQHKNDSARGRMCGYVGLCTAFII